MFNDFNILIFLTLRLSNKPYLIWLLTTPPHLKYAATLPCNLSLLACFADINVSQGSVATYAMCGRIFSMHLIANLPGNLTVKKIVNRLRFDRIMVMSLWPRFFAHPVYTWRFLGQPLSYRTLNWSVGSQLSPQTNNLPQSTANALTCT